MVKVVKGPSERHRVAKWFKRSLQWCFQALSLRCLRRSKRAVYAVQEPPTYNCAQVQRPTCDFVYQSSFRCAPIPDTEDEDDLDMRIARQTAAEIEWQAETMGTIDVPKKSGLWSEDEHERYCQGLDKFRYGSWKLIAEYVGTRTERQVLSHAQSIRAKRKRAEEREKAMEGGAPTTSKNARTSARRLPPTARSDVRRFQFDGIEFVSGGGHPSAAGVEQSELIPTCLTNDYQADEFALADVGISSDALLSPLDILLGSSVSDEGFLELLDIPSTPSDDVHPTI